MDIVIYSESYIPLVVVDVDSSMVPDRFLLDCSNHRISLEPVYVKVHVVDLLSKVSGITTAIHIIKSRDEDSLLNCNAKYFFNYEES